MDLSDQTVTKSAGLDAKVIFQTMLMSDLHLEFKDVIPPEFPVIAPNLILAGDIGRPDVPSLRKFLLAQCQRFEHIFYVAGNHCFYEGEYEDRLEQLRELDNLNPRIHFLQNKSYLLPNNVRILGTTLWSHVPQETASRIGRSLNDYRYIWIVEKHNVPDGKVKRRRRITVDDTNEWHAQQHAWLLQEIQQARENREHVVVITHHAPVRRDTCSIEDEESGLMDAFVNDHDADCVDPVRLWVYGHTHRSTDLTINSTRVVSNQVGYAHENCGFRPNMSITLYDDGAVTVTDVVSYDS
jgi:predicted phosphohydrolase